MKTLTTTEDLARFCEAARGFPYVTIDTEFLRERTYYAKLCLVQLAVPAEGEDSAVLVDPLAEGLSLDPLYALLADTSVVKVLHAARQDLEIFFIEGGVLPAPLFDTQVAAMVCGFGEQVGYETLVRRIARAKLDKTSRFTDWSRRPLTDIYEYLSAELEKSGRTAWVEEELATLADPETYIVHPGEAWRRIKTRTNSGRFLAIVRELARFREGYAQSRNIPRSRVYKDDALLELASTKPQNAEDLGRSRLLLREARKGEVADGILAAVKAGLDCPAEDLPAAEGERDRPQADAALADLLRVLLKAKSEDAGVAQKLIATASELDEIAAGQRDVKALTGWRRDVFGTDALRLCDGQLALRADRGRVKVVEL